jgi:hypothetical protein
MIRQQLLATADVYDAERASCLVQPWPRRVPEWRSCGRCGPLQRESVARAVFPHRTAQEDDDDDEEAQDRDDEPKWVLGSSSATPFGWRLAAQPRSYYASCVATRYLRHVRRRCMVCR